MSALLLVHRDISGQTRNIPFVYRDGKLHEALERLANHLTKSGSADALWEGVAADRLGIILQQQVHIRDLEKIIEEIACE